MAEIKVTSTTIREKSSTLKSISNNIKTISGEINQEVSKIKPIWEGEASESFIKKYTELYAVLQQIPETISKYSQFLDTAAEGFAAAENANINASSSLNSK
jgi:WXG100 family type VII secretion target